MEKEQSIQKNIEFTLSEWIGKFLAYAQENEAALAVWKLPHEQEIQLLIDQDGGQEQTEIHLESLSQGFVIHPFNHSTSKARFFNADISAKLPIIDNTGENSEKRAIIWNSVKEKQEVEITEKIANFNYSKLKNINSIRSTSREDYIKMVEIGIKAIKQEAFYKIVPSKIKLQAYTHLNIENAFLKACEKYPTAFVNLTFSPSTGLWLGASPETLIEEKAGEFFKTMALAGTQKATEADIADTSWTQKEIEEQALVSRYIINCFKKIRLREYEEIGPKTIKAGHLLHLKTTYKVDTKAVNFPDLGSVMLKLLHPTSAVCGMPKAPALEFIEQREQHDRSYFSGYLGPVHHDEKSHLFVNLRCAQIIPDQIIYYAGAGITEESKAEKEWEETEMKCHVLANILIQ